MRECCIFKEKDLRKAFSEAEFEHVKTISYESGEDPFGDEYSNRTALVRCRRCGALCLEITKNVFGFGMNEDDYDTVYVPVADLAEAERIGACWYGHRYIRYHSREFAGEEYSSGGPDE